MTHLVVHANNVSAQWAGAMWAAVWQSAVLAILIFLLTLTLRRASSTLRFWLWMLVPLRLLIMPLVTIDLPVLPADKPEIAISAPSGATAPMYVETAAPAESVPDEYFWSEGIPVETTAPMPAPDAAVDAPASGASLTVWTYLMAAWVCGVLLVALRSGVGYWKTRRLVAGASPVLKGRYVDLARQAARMLKLRRIPDVRITKERVSPFVLGVWKPVVVLPTSFLANVNHKQLLAVLAHEAAHLRRNDFLVGWVIAACETLYFFHPVVHFVNRRLLLEREKACDDWVLVTSRAKPSHYAQAILSAAKSTSAVDKHLQPHAVVAESFTMLRDRLASIASTVTPKAGLSVWACVFPCVLAALCIPGIALTAKEVRLAESITPGPVATATSEELSSGDTTSGTDDDLERLAQADAANDGFRVLHFPEDSGLGTISVRTRRATATYRLGRESPIGGWDRWEEVSSARGAVQVPIGKPVKLTIYAGGIPYLHYLSGLAPNDLHTISFQLDVSTPNERKLTDEQVLPYVKNLTGLKALELFSIEATGRGFRYIKDLINLERLELGSESYFEDSSLVHLQNMTSLRALNLYVPVSDKGLQYLTALTSLRELSVKYQNIRGHGLAHVASIPTLEFLEIRGDGTGNRSRGPSNTALQHLAGAPSLRSLLLYSTTKINDNAIPRLAKLANLEELKIIKGWGGSGNGEIRITDAGMPALGRMTQLVSLDLGATSVTDRGMAHLRGLKNLEKLRLPTSRQTRAGGETITDATLAHVSQLPQLKQIFAGRGAFTDEGLRHLAGLRRLESLVLNSSSEAGTTDAGLAYLADLPKLRKLNIHWDEVTNQGLTHLAKIRSLRTLELDSNMDRITVGGVNALNSLINLRVLKISRVNRDTIVLDLGALTKLESLSIRVKSSNPRIRAGAIRNEDLASIGNLSRLTYLWVGDSPHLTDAGLAPISKLKRLERLGIGGKRLSDQCLSHLAGLTSLYQLTISGDFTDEGLRQLDGLTALRYLTIKSRQGVSPQTEHRIRRNLPNLFSLNTGRMGARN